MTVSSFATPRVVMNADSPLHQILRTAARIAATEATVLLTGETGTGKEVLARFIHEHSPRSAGPFIPVNCGAIPEALLESELFGHTKCAFTGAINARKGRIAMAEGGTLFLDELGELPLSLQVKLLRVLQERTFDPVGASESQRADFRLVAATNRDLRAEVEAGRFRRDLYYRLLVCPVELLPLRERQGDIPVLFRHFWSARGETRVVDGAVLDALCAYAWPGNIRELENLVERISVCTESDRITLADLPAPLRPAARPVLTLATPVAAPAPNLVVDALAGREDAMSLAFTPAGDGLPAAAPSEPAPLVPNAEELVSRLPLDLAQLLRTLEDQFIDIALQRSGGNKKAAADLLGLQRTTLVEKLRRRQRDAGPELAMAAAV